MNNHRTIDVGHVLGSGAPDEVEDHDDEQDDHEDSNEAVAHLFLSLIGVGLFRVESAVKRFAPSAVTLPHGVETSFPTNRE